MIKSSLSALKCPSCNKTIHLKIENSEVPTHFLSTHRVIIEEDWGNECLVTIISPGTDFHHLKMKTKKNMLKEIEEDDNDEDIPADPA